jgi:thymidylate synthase (FAD)
MRIVQPSVSLEWITLEAMKAIERAGRVCYKSEDKITDESAQAFCRMIYQKGHESVLEHGVASLRIVCDRGVSHEIVRHRLASYSQESTRYCNYSKEKFGNEIAVICPPGLNSHEYVHWENAVVSAERAYFELIRAGQSPQIARSVLPTCLKTELVMTTNFREWKHFLKLRTDKASHPQMQEVAFMVKDILARECPYFFGEETK